MAITVRKLDKDVAFAAASAFNLFMVWFVTAKTTLAHFDVTSTTSGGFTGKVATPLTIVNNSTASLSTVILMAEEMRTVLLTIFADTTAHKAADTTDAALITLLAVPTAVDQGTVNVLLEAEATAYTAHIASTTYHPTADSTNVLTSAAATTLASSKTRAADLRTQILAHILNAPPSPSLNIIPA